MNNDEYMRIAGFKVPHDYEPWSRTHALETSAIDGRDFILRVGDLPAQAGECAALLEEWAQSVGYNIENIDVAGAVKVLFTSVVISAIRDERVAAGKSGLLGVNHSALLKDGAPARFENYCARIDGDFLMVFLAEQFDEAVGRGAPVRSAVKRRRRDGRG